MPLSAGDKLGLTRSLRPVGEGGMGEVYKARDSRLNRIVAIKVSKEQFTDRFGARGATGRIAESPVYLPALRCGAELPGVRIH